MPCTVVLDQLCKHKQAVTIWSTTAQAECLCKNRPGYKTAVLNPSDPHWVLSGSLLTDLLPPELAVIAEDSLLNKVFPVKKGYLAVLARGLCKWTKDNGLPSIPKSKIADLGQLLWQQHSQHLTNHITKTTIKTLESTFEGAIFHCEDKQLSLLPTDLLPLSVFSSH